MSRLSPVLFLTVLVCSAVNAQETSVATARPYCAQAVAADAVAHLVTALVLILTETHGGAYDILQSTTGIIISSESQSYLNTAAWCLAPLIYHGIYQTLVSPQPQSNAELFSSLITRVFLPYPIAHTIIHTA